MVEYSLYLVSYEVYKTAVSEEAGALPHLYLFLS